LVSTHRVIQRLSDFIEQLLPVFNAPGIAIGFVNRDQILHVCGYSLRDREAGEPVTPRTLFHIGSISKSFTSIVLLQLQKRGLPDINDPVVKYLPWFEIQSEYPLITLRHLMSHTARIINGSDEIISAYTGTWNLRRTKAAKQPGEMFHYSNTGYKVIGVVLERLFGKGVAEILQEHILTPVGMRSTLPVFRNRDRASLAVGYALFFDESPLPAGGMLAPAAWFEYDNADGLICSNAGDISKYLQTLLGCADSLLSPKSFDLLIEPLVPIDNGLHGEHYGLGLESQQIDGHQVIGHGGGMVGCAADLLADLDSGLGVVVLTNGPSDSMKISRYALALLNADFRGHDLPEPEDVDPHHIKDAETYLGTYRCGGKSFMLTPQANHVILEFETGSVLLQPHPQDSFLTDLPGFDVFPLQIKRKNNHVVEAFYGSERYLRGPDSAEQPYEIPAEWLAYRGYYRTDIPWNTGVRVVRQQDALVLFELNGGCEPLD